MTDPPISETSEATPSEATKRLNQWSAEVIARREQEAAEAAAKKAAEDKVRLEQINAVMAKNRILAFNCGKPRNPLYPEIREPNPLQVQLLNAWRDPKYKVFTYMGANRIGKCLTYQTLVETPHGEISAGELFERGEPFEVYSWDGQERVVALAMPPFKKEGLHQCYRITMTDGRTIEAADHHLILCADGVYRAVATLAALFPSCHQSICGGDPLLSSDFTYLQESSAESCLSGQPQDVPSYAQSPLCVCSNKIECITPIIASQECYDFEVPVYKNYFAGGLIHHNTTIGAILAISTLRGEWPWSGEKIPFSHTNPRRVAYVGQGWETHIKSVIIPALKFWWPEDQPLKTRKNNQGCDAQWEFWSRSHNKGMQGEIQIFSTSQDVTVFEGAQYDLVIYDEPPPRDIRVACARGLVDRKGRELFCCTLLNQAWIHREIIRAVDAKGEPDPSYFNLSGDSSVNIGYGITQEGIDQFAKTLTADEYQARILGKPSYLSALVCPRFDRKTHIKERFTIPLNALIDISIDWHPSKPLMVVFMATLSNGVKYICDEIKFRGNIKSATEEIVRVIRMRDYTRINKVIIDPLSKSGQPNDSDAFSVMEEILMPYGYALEVASKEKENGIELLNNLLWTQNECPAIFFFRDCVNSIQEVEDLMYDENGKPMKVNDDAFECIYRLSLLDTQWFEEWKNRVEGSHRSVVL